MALIRITVYLMINCAKSAYDVGREHRPRKAA